MSHREFKSIPFEVKAISDEGHGSFEGLGAAALNLDAVGDIIAKGAFTDGLDDFIKTGFIGGLGHNWDIPIGHPAAAHETPDGHLFVKGVFDGSPEAQADRARMTPHPETGRATVSRLSIGYKAIDPERLGPDEVKAYWATAGYTPNATDLERSKSGARLLRKIRVFEVSPVLVPANDLARTTGVKSAAPAGFADTSRKVASIAREASEEFAGFVRAAGRRAGLRLKEGRVLSDANRRAMQDVLDGFRAHHGAIGASCDQLAGILERTAPPAKSDAPAAAPATDDDAIEQAYIAHIAASRARALA
jgi:hypothetical protein